MLAAAMGAAAHAHAQVLSQVQVQDLPSTVQQYIRGWTAHDGQQVLGALAQGAGYRDPDMPQARHGAAIADYAAQYRDARFTLLGADTMPPGTIRLRWAIRWPDARGTSHYDDLLHMRDGTIQSVDSTGTPDAAAAQLVARYIALHSQPTRAGLAALVTPDFAVFSTKSPPDGRRGDDYLRFLQRFSWATFAQDTDQALLLAKDNRLVLAWTMRVWRLRLASGVDYLTLQDGRIRQIVAVY